MISPRKEDALTAAMEGIRFADVIPEFPGFRHQAAPPRQGISGDMGLGWFGRKPPVLCPAVFAEVR